jgi:hypothetical protein
MGALSLASLMEYRYSLLFIDTFRLNIEHRKHKQVMLFKKFREEGLASVILKKIYPHVGFLSKSLTDQHF